MDEPLRILQTVDRFVDLPLSVRSALLGFWLVSFLNLSSRLVASELTLDTLRLEREDTIGCCERKARDEWCYRLRCAI